MGNKSMKAGILITAFGAACWGISGCFGQYLFQNKEVNAEWLVAVRLISAGFLLVLISLFKDGKRTFNIFKDKKDALQLLMFAFCGMLISQYTYFAAIQYSNAGTATVLQSTSSILILIFVCIKQRRLPEIKEAVLITGCFAGVFLLTTHGNFNSIVITKYAFIFGMGAAIGAALYSILAGGLLDKYGIYVVVGFGMMISGIVFNLIVKPWNYNVVIDVQTLIAVLGVVIVGTALAFSAFLKGVSIIGPLKGSLLGSMEPIVAIVAGIIFLNAEFQVIDIAGFVLILGSVTLLTITNNN